MSIKFITSLGMYHSLLTWQICLKDFSRNHEHETHQALILDEPNVNTSNGENCIRYLLPRIINKTNHTIVTMVDTYSYQGFVNFVKNDMIGHYISNCYICNHTHSE